MTQQLVLANARSGYSYRLKAVDGGLGMKTRLSAMGLSSGCCFRVVRNKSDGPVVIGIKDMRLAIGRGMARKVHIEESNR